MTDIALQQETIQTALGAARELGVVVRRPGPEHPDTPVYTVITSMEMNDILVAAAEKQNQHDTVFADQQAALFTAERRVEELKQEERRLNGVLAPIRAEMREAQEVSDIYETVRSLLASLEGAWWLRAADDYNELKRTVNDGCD